MWFFRAPLIVFGPDSINHLSTLPIERAAIIVDRNLIQSKQLQMVISSLPKKCKSKIVGDIPEEPSFAQISAPLATLREFAPDCIIAVGGGSTIDASKIVFFSYERPDLSFYDVTPLQILNLRKKTRLVAVPTTSGTGSDATWAAVMTEELGHRKIELASPEIIPDVSILDPAMVVSLPPEQTRSTGVDALTHSIEAFVSLWGNPFSDAFAEKSIMIITKNLPAVLESPSDIEKRNQVHIAATMAGLAFSNSQIGLAHALGHALGAHFRIPHGKSVGLFLPKVIEFNYLVAGEKYDRLNSLIPIEFRKKVFHESVSRLFTAIRQPLSIAETGINVYEYSSKIDDMVDLASESTGLTLNPREASRNDLKAFFNDVITSSDSVTQTI